MAKIIFFQSSLECSVVTYSRDSIAEKTLFVQANSKVMFHVITSFWVVFSPSTLYFKPLTIIPSPDWLGKFKPSKLSTGCQNEFKGAVVEKAMDLGSRFLFFAALPLVVCTFASLPLSSARRKLPCYAGCAVHACPKFTHKETSTLLSSLTINVLTANKMMEISSIPKLYILHDY